MRELKVVTHSPRETQDLGRLLGAAARPGDLLLLSGPLGAGKTCLTQGIAFGLGVDEYVRSPSFVIVSRYRGRLHLYHIDLYRLDDPGEIADLPLEEYLTGRDVCVVEWAEKGAALFPEEHMWIEMAYGEEENERQIGLTALGDRYKTVLKALDRLYQDREN